MRQHARGHGRSGIRALRQFAGAEAPESARPERCELCTEPIGARHRHLLNMESREVECACDPCALRFEGTVGGRYKLVPRDIYSAEGLRIEDALWNRLSLPINLAFFFYRTPQEEEGEGRAAGSGEEPEVTAMYPSPAGATESLLPLAAWDALAEQHPALEAIEPDVRALLVNRVEERDDYYLAPIDWCYRLVGLIRLHWRGFSGGEEVWAEIDGVFEELDRQSRPWRGANA